MAMGNQGVTLSTYATSEQHDLIDQASKRLGHNRPEFRLEAAGRQAGNVLLDQAFFALQTDRFAAFTTMLNKPTQPVDRLGRTLNAKALCEATVHRLGTPHLGKL
jgi:uncharacterized protein (DUF1778 family)